jgi:hypothetical protein
VITTKAFLAIPIAFFLASFALSAEAQYVGRIQFQGGPATGASNLWIQIRDGTGSSVLATSLACQIRPNDPVGTIRDCVAEGWDQAAVDCFSEGADILGLLVPEPFTCFASTDSSLWTEITPIQPFMVVGVTLASVGNIHSIPTLSEWGMLALVFCVTALGGLVLLRRLRPARA